MEEWKRLLNELRRELTVREQELDLLHAIDLRLLQPEQSARDIFDFIVEETRRLLQANHTTILLRRSTFLEPMYSNLESIIGQRVPISESLTGLSLESNSLVNAPDVKVGKYAKRYTPLRGYEGPRMRSLLATPIKIRDTIVGVLNAESTRPNAFKGVHERIATAIASQVAIALQRTQTLASTSLLADVDRLMFNSDDSQHAAEHSEHVIQTALEKVMAELKRLEHVQHSGAQIMFLRGEHELEIVHSTNPSDIGLLVQMDKSVSGRALTERQTVIVGDVMADPDYQRLLGDSIRSEIAVPILFGEDDVPIGVLNVESNDLDAFYGFYQLVLEDFAEKVKTLLAFAKLRADVTETLELRSADDLLLAVGDQTSHVIHRLNNTVGAMRFQILELQEKQADGTLDDESLTSALDSLHDLADRTLRLPSEITPLGGEGTTIDVDECVRKAIGQLVVPDDVILDVQLADDIPPLPLYCFDIVVQNLLQNGLDAMPTGGRLSVCTAQILDPTHSKGYLQLSVSDTGNGIPVDVQKRIFELNFTTKDAKGKGLGLGLWWVRNFVRRSRGDITIRSIAGAGTDAIVKIPIGNSADIIQTAAAD
jgi:signal transduction histidine kinase